MCDQYGLQRDLERWLRDAYEAVRRDNQEHDIDGSIRGIKPLSPFGPIRIDAGSHCWEQTTRLDTSMVGKRVRLYGINDTNMLRQTGDVQVGYFAFEVVE